MAAGLQQQGRPDRLGVDVDLPQGRLGQHDPAIELTIQLGHPDGGFQHGQRWSAPIRARCAPGTWSHSSSTRDSMASCSAWASAWPNSAAATQALASARAVSCAAYQ